MISHQLRKCFIAAPGDCDTSLLRAELEKRHIVWSDSFSVQLGEPFIGTTQAAIRAADFVFGVLTSHQYSGSVFFELGIALAEDKPTLIFAEPSVEVPFTFQSLALARTSISNGDALTRYLDAFLEKGGVLRPKDESRIPQAKTVDVTFARSFLSHTENKMEAEWLRLVGRLFSEAGALVTPNPEMESNSDKHGVEVDMSVWLDATQAIFGNPMLVEIKPYYLSGDSFVAASLQLQRIVQEAQVQTALLIYLERAENEFLRVSPSIIPISIHELVDFVGQGELVSGLIRKRNQIVHGGAHQNASAIAVTRSK